ncbi:MAG: ABC transporter ATP-binding protein/permease [Planctomycetota bacterium]|nr:ABC transporter ATP-binding protein/permease [Planctomycetota bacterium]
MKNVLRALRYLLAYKGRLALFVFASLGLAASSSVPLYLINNAIKHILISGGGGGGRERELWIMCGVLFGCWAIKGYFDFRASYTQKWMAHRVRLDVLNRVMSHLIRLSLSFFDRQKTGQMVATLIADMESLRDSVRLACELIREPLRIAGFVAGVFVINPWLALIGFVGFPLAVGPILVLGRRILKASRRFRRKRGDLADLMIQIFGGMRIIKAYGGEEAEAKGFLKVSNKMFRLAIKKARARALAVPLVECLNGLGAVAAILVGGTLVIRGVLEANELFTFLLALVGLHAPVKGCVNSYNELQEFVPGAERAFKLMDERPDVTDAPDAEDLPPFRDRIVLENVTFDYGRGPVLRNVNLEIRAGETIGIVGRSGSGKTTLCNLLLRFYDPVGGRVMVDGRDLRKVRLASLYRQVALVAQETFLFNTTVMENIRFGRPEAGDEEAIEAAKAAGIHDEIVAFPEGYGTLVGERGMQLSGGQRQRIAVARAILRNAPILILDEATSALDSESERLVQAAIDRMIAGRTTIVVAHRLSTLRNCDRIVVLDDGKVEAVGPHEVLLESSPTYRKLWENQQSGGGEWERAAGSAPAAMGASVPHPFKGGVAPAG